jgi:PII-like signaling protein
MQGLLFRFYVHEGHRHHGRLAWEWLLEQGNKLGIRGGSAFKAMAGFGRHHVVHEARFFELAGTLTVEVEFIVSPEEAQKLLDLLHKEKVRLFYAYTPACFGVINPDSSDPPTVSDCPESIG